jgi:murein DD-endopeptidase MepM/ murein hydrolase activator NlpD
LNKRDPQRGQGDGAFGTYRNHGGGQHTGIDITAPVGTPVVAAGDGTVANIQPNPSKTYGNQIVIEHPGGFYTQYGHLSRVDVAPGTVVHAGDPIGLSGRSGDVPAKADAHLHFEVRRGSMRPHAAGGDVADPTDYLPVTP